MVDLRTLFSSLLVMLNKETYILLRAEFLVVVVTVLFLVMSILDIFRRHFHSPLIKSIFNILDTVSDSIVVYILGFMKTAPIKNQLFPVWAIVIVNFRNSIDFISGYGVPDRSGRRFTEFRNVTKLSGVAFLYQTSKSKFVLPLWSLWGIQILRSFYRFHTRNLAVMSIWHGGSSSLISEYMRTYSATECDPETMKGYKYLVYGETKQNVKFRKPRYAFEIDPHKQKRKSCISRKTTRSIDAITTLDKIWQCNGALLKANNSNGGDLLKNIPLAFALSRLLRCRLQDVTLPADAFLVNKKLIKTRIIQQDANHAFGIMDLQLAFLNDYFNTRYPMVFWYGLPSLFFSLIQSVVTFAVVCWLSVDIRKVYKPPESDTAHIVNGLNVDIIITWVFMFFMMFKEIWEMVTYLLSDWTRLLLTCMYERFECRWMRNNCTERIILSFFTSKLIAKRWHGVIDQYVFLQSYDGSPTIWNLFHKLSFGTVPKKDEGAQLGDAINIPDFVKPAILKSLVSLDLTNDYLPKEIKSLTNVDGDQREAYRWACFELPTCSHIILVWHIATSICEMELAKRHSVNLGKPGFFCGLLSCFSCSRKSYLVDEKKLSGSPELQKNYIIANSLSRYCGYLLVSRPELIPDSFLVPKRIFQATVKHARGRRLKNCDSLQNKYEKLKEEGERAAEESDEVKNSEDILRQGALLAKELLKDDNGPEHIWKILAEVWAELVVHIAPSWNAAAHKKCLESGGEFITQIWALLWHCGIEKSKLWPVEAVPRYNAPEAHPCKNDNTTQEMPHASARLGERVGTDTSRPEMQQASAQVPSDQTMKKEAQVNDGIGDSISETSIRQSEKMGTGVYEIEEELDKEDTLEEELHGQIDTEVQKQMEGGIASTTPIESENIRRGGNTMPWPDKQMYIKNHSVKSRHDGLELVGTKMTGCEDNHLMVKIATEDWGYRSGLVNRHGNVVRGMKNLGSTCYFNAVLQSLFALDNLRARILGLNAQKGSLGEELKNVFMEMSSANNARDPVLPENLFKIMSSYNLNFKLNVMEDSNNMLTSLLDGLNNEEPRMVQSLFYGEVAKHVSSRECGHTLCTRQKLDLSLAIPSKKKLVSIEDCLELYASGDINDWHCTDCPSASGAGNASSHPTDSTLFEDDQTEQLDSETYPREQPSHLPDKQTNNLNQDKRKLRKQNGGTHEMGKRQNQENKIYRAATIKYYITKAPPILIIQLKRFIVHNATAYKMEEHVSFLETLDIRNYMDPGHMENEDYRYCLVAVVEHFGPNLDKGHNSAYVRASAIGAEQESGATHSWFHASDENVKEVLLKEVLNCQAYILFYERLGM
ncbi:unnamed protein product [Urochloa decumbens]|uniref:USP domain-containing protein n=1 Tax=Urochloa decumbens TaxID=240449 RepID=A0ABC9AWX9_9POAL